MKNFVAVIFAVLLQVAVVLGQRNWLPQTVSAYEMWNPATWYYPYGIAASEAWAEYLKNAQQVTNQLYDMYEKTGAANLYNPNVANVGGGNGAEDGGFPSVFPGYDGRNPGSG